jgi:hypothetical protein
MRLLIGLGAVLLALVAFVVGWREMIALGGPFD